MYFMYFVQIPRQGMDSFIYCPSFSWLQSEPSFRDFRFEIHEFTPISGVRENLLNRPRLGLHLNFLGVRSWLRGAFLFF